MEYAYDFASLIEAICQSSPVIRSPFMRDCPENWSSDEFRHAPAGAWESVTGERQSIFLRIFPSLVQPERKDPRVGSFSGSRLRLCISFFRG